MQNKDESRAGYAHFMLQEIYEQPQVFHQVLQERIQEGQIVFKELSFSAEEVQKWRKIYIVACGTAYHSGLFGQALLEKFLGLPVAIEIASEFRYRQVLAEEATLAIVISQSGETADTLAALRKAKNSGMATLALTNVQESTIAREADERLYLGAGPEIAVASTKAYTVMLIMQYLLSLYLAEKKGTLHVRDKQEIIAALWELPVKAQQILAEGNLCEAIVQKIKDVQSVFFIGRLFDYYLALEGALKLKETSYLHAEAYAAGEIRHGTMAIVTPETPVFAVAVQEEVYQRTLHIVQEVVAKGAPVFAVVSRGDQEMQKWAQDILYIPQIKNIVSPILAVLPLQLLAYYTAVARGCNVDQPRNLTKAVTED